MNTNHNTFSHKAAFAGSKKHHLTCWKKIPDKVFNKNRLIFHSDSFSSVEITQVCTGDWSSLGQSSKSPGVNLLF